MNIEFAALAHIESESVLKHIHFKEKNNEKGNGYGRNAADASTNIGKPRRRSAAMTAVPCRPPSISPSGASAPGNVNAQGTIVSARKR